MADGRLEFPLDYREWVFLSAGHGMTYGPSANPNGPPFFDKQRFTETAGWAFFQFYAGH